MNQKYKMLMKIRSLKPANHVKWIKDYLKLGFNYKLLAIIITFCDQTMLKNSFKRLFDVDYHVHLIKTFGFY